MKKKKTNKKEVDRRKILFGAFLIIATIGILFFAADAVNISFWFTDSYDTNNPGGNPGEFLSGTQKVAFDSGSTKLDTVPCKEGANLCSIDEQCCSGHCADGVCCNTACSGSRCQRCDDYSSAGAGTCGYIDTAIDPDNECSPDLCSTANCSGASYSCGVQPAGGGNCPLCQYCDGTHIVCQKYDNYEEIVGCSDKCTGCNNGVCINFGDGKADTIGSNTCFIEWVKYTEKCDGKGNCKDFPNCHLSKTECEPANPRERNCHYTCIEAGHCACQKGFYGSGCSGEEFWCGTNFDDEKKNGSCKCIPYYN